jgi:branched-chain amino acid transport system ATP-binding protein
LRSRRRAANNDNRAVDPVCRELLVRTGLESKAALWPHELSYGERRRLEIARALAIEPKLLLLDEPAAGMVPSEQMELATMIRGISKSGVAVILIEHHMDLVASVAGKVMVLNFGCLIVEGTIDVIRSHPEVISAYLGSTAR